MHLISPDQASRAYSLHHLNIRYMVNIISKVTFHKLRKSCREGKSDKNFRSSHIRYSIKKVSLFIKKETLTQVCPFEFCEIFKNAFLTEHLSWLLQEFATCFKQWLLNTAINRTLLKRIIFHQSNVDFCKYPANFYLLKINNNYTRKNIFKVNGNVLS